MLLNRRHMYNFTGSRSVTALHCKKTCVIKCCSFLDDLLPKRIKVDPKSGASSGYSLERRRLLCWFCLLQNIKREQNGSASQARISGQDCHITLQSVTECFSDLRNSHHISCTPTFHYRFHNGQPFFHILSQKNPFMPHEWTISATLSGLFLSVSSTTYL